MVRYKASQSKISLQLFLLCSLTISACNLPIRAPWSASPTATAVPTITPKPDPTPNLSERPQVWFAPLPPLPILPRRPFLGAEDFMDLFKEDAAWLDAAGRVNVFKLYSWIAWNASEAEVRQVISDLNRRGIAIAFEAGPLNPTDSCGEGIEGFAGVNEGLTIARRIKAAGGTVRYVDFDHPFDAGVLDTSPNACHWSPEQVAQDIARYVTAIRNIFPEVIFGTTETAGHNANLIAEWVDAYSAVVGENLGFVHVDLDYSKNDWPEKTKQIETVVRSKGIEFGIIYFGSWYSRTDEDWLALAGEHVKSYELEAGGLPDHVLFQSWQDHPDRSLPETEPYTFTWFVNSYLKDKSSLGFRTEGPGADLAFGRSVKASKSDQYPAEWAVDGNPDTTWGAGDFAPQWIEIDLGKAYTIREIHLQTSMGPLVGETTHQVFVRGPGTGDQEILLHTFEEVTKDYDVLTVPMEKALESIQFVRIKTLSSPSWLAWREIIILDGG